MQKVIVLRPRTAAFVCWVVDDGVRADLYSSSHFAVSPLLEIADREHFKEWVGVD